MRRTFACLVAGLALFLVHASGAWAADKTLDLKVLVISTGNASVDPGLDLMDDLLNEVGVPYDVLDSSTQVLTPGQLSSGDHGFYNGIILTNSELFLPDGTGSGFNFLEWDVLHAFERDFAVRESYIYDVDLANYNPVTLGEGVGSTGWTLLEGPYVSETATNYDFTEPCFVAG